MSASEFDPEKAEHPVPNGAEPRAVADTSKTEQVQGQTLQNFDDISELKRQNPDAIIVEWEKGDPENPFNWSIMYRLYLTALVFMLNTGCTFASSLPNSLLEEISDATHVSIQVVKVAVFIYVGGFAAGPLVWAPLSELFGTRPILIASCFLATIFQMASALAPNIGGLIVFRFLAGTLSSAILAVGGGIFSNIFDKDLLAFGMAVHSLGASGGPAVGPLVGAWVHVEGASWHWGLWACCILEGCLTVLAIFTLKETNKNFTLTKKAKRLRHETGNKNYKSVNELRSFKANEFFDKWLLVPFKMILFEPMVLSTSVYFGFLYSTLYLFFVAFPIVFGELHGLNPVQFTMIFLSYFAGELVVAVFIVLVENRRYMKKRAASPTGKLPPEERLRCSLVGSPLMVMSLFWFAWTCYPSISIWSPIMAIAAYGAAFYCVKKPNR
ncbi:hypothetical protein MNAN1_000393 [Malassezia nana]|uniref:Major facilitator superfamily (MFS) profile domain-containing protein n=1 Tax=Malassezia nana TaxID=180528 RepID=A0AAF0J0W5_9BASI|nr:hypothetical protein MNAN1_000393 [Malassezia nana]